MPRLLPAAAARACVLFATPPTALAAELECPTIDVDTQNSVAVACLGDDEGLCGEQCFSAIRDAALARSDDVEIACGDGLDDVLEQVKGCMKREAGLDWVDCDGRNVQRIVDYADKIKCEGGGTLADKLE